MKKLTVAAAAVLTMSLGVASAAKITVWTDFQSGGELEWLQIQAKAFQATPAAKGDTFEIISLPNGELRDKFIQSAPKGQGPDLAATIPHDQIGQMVTAGVLEPVQKYIGVTDNSKSSLDAFNFEGKIFGFPMFGEAVAVVYNKKLVPNFPKTWDQFIKTAQSLTKPEQQQFGFLAPIGIQYHDFGFFTSFGAYVFGKNSNGSLNKADIGLNSEGALKAAQLINDLRFKYKLIPDGAEDGGLEKNLFTTGKLAMYLTGPWDMADVKKAGIDYGIAVLPKPTGATGPWRPFIGIRGIVLNSYSKNKTGAAAFAKFLIQPTQQVSLNKIGGRIPVSRSAVTQLKDDETTAGFGKAIAVGIPMPNIAAMGQVWDPWGNAIALTIKTANPDVKKLFDEAVRQIKANIK